MHVILSPSTALRTGFVEGRARGLLRRGLSPGFELIAHPYNPLPTSP